MTDYFYIQASPSSSNPSGLIEAKYLKYPNGSNVQDPYTTNNNLPIYDSSGNQIGTNSNNYLIVPADYSFSSAQNLADSISSNALSQAAQSSIVNTTASPGSIIGFELSGMISSFRSGGAGDLQTVYDGGVYGNQFVGAFQDAASYNLGATSAFLSLPLIAAEVGGGMYNLAKLFDGEISLSQVVPSGLFNGPGNVASMTEGYNDANNILDNGDSALTPLQIDSIPGDFFQTAEITPLSSSLYSFSYNTGLNITVSLDSKILTAQYSSSSAVISLPTSDLNGIASDNAGTPKLELNGDGGATLTLSNQTAVSLTGIQTVDYSPASGDITLSTPTYAGSTAPNNLAIVSATFSTVTDIGTITTVIGPETTQTPINSSAGIAGGLAAAVSGAFGSGLGRVIVGSNPLAQIAVSTGLGTTLSDIATLIENLGPSGDLAAAYNSAIADFPTSVEAGGAGAVASYLSGELVNALGLPAFPAAVLNTSAGYAVSTIASNLAQGLDPITGAGSEAPATDLSNIANWELLGAQFIGSEIGSAIYQPSTIQGDEGAAVLSAVGSAVEAYEILQAGIETLDPYIIVAAAISAILDYVLGGVIGDLFGQETTSHISEANFSMSGSATTPLSFSYTTSSYQNGPVDDAAGEGEAVVDALNDVLAAVGGVVLDVSSLTSFGVGFNTDAAPGTDSTGADYTNPHGGLAYYYYDNTAGTNPQYWAVSTTLQQVTDHAILRELSEMVFSGGDPYIERAIDATLRSAAAPTSATLAGYIQVAQDYERYEANKATINAIIESDTTSQISQNWISELLLAGAMGFGTSVQGGAWDDTLRATSALKILIGGGSDSHGDTYQFDAGDGHVTILNGVSTMNVAEGQLDLGTGLQFSQTTPQTNFTQNGSNLIINFTSDATDQVTVDGNGSCATTAPGNDNTPRLAA